MILNEALRPREQAGGGEASRAGLRWPIELAWTLPFLILYWVNIAHHYLWRDELNAWTIAVVSPTLSALFRLVHYEAHPWLWYVVLWLPSRITTAPVAMKWVEACIGTAIYLVIGLKSPFTRLEKVLIFLGYFVVFEYTVMSRMYGIMLLCALLYAWRRMEKPQGVVGIAAILSVMANSDMTGVLLSGALLLAYAHECWTWREQWTELGLTRARIAAALLLYLGAVAISIHSLMPAPDISWQSSGRLFSEAFRPVHIARAVVDVVAAPWWPISGEFPTRFWDTDVRTQRGLEVLMPLVLFAYWHCFRRRRNALLLMALALGCAIFFADAVYLGRVRHWGITLTAFLVAIWSMRAQLNALPVKGRASRLPASAYALLGLSAIAGGAAIFSSWTHPFSQSGNVAKWLQDNHLADAALVGNPDVSFASVAEQLQRPVYFLECACTDRFKLFSRDRETFLEQELADRLALAQKNLKTDTLIYVCYRPLMTQFDLPRFARRSLTVTPMASFPGADASLESFYIYRVTKSHGQ